MHGCIAWPACRQRRCEARAARPRQRCHTSADGTADARKRLAGELHRSARNNDAAVRLAERVRLCGLAVLQQARRPTGPRPLMGDLLACSRSSCVRLIFGMISSWCEDRRGDIVVSRGVATRDSDACDVLRDSRPLLGGRGRSGTGGGGVRNKLSSDQNRFSVSAMRSVLLFFCSYCIYIQFHSCCFTTRVRLSVFARGVRF